MKRTAAIILSLFAGLLVWAFGCVAEPADGSLDPYSLIDLSEYGSAGLIRAEGIDENQYAFTESGLKISGKKGKTKNGVYSIAGGFDFGTENDGAPVRRVMIDGLAKLGTNVTVKLYLDDEREPFAVKQLAMQAEKDSWDEQRPVFFELDGPVYGRHSIRFTIEDANTADNKKTAALIRGIRFYRDSGLPVVYAQIDESLGSVEAMNADPKHETRCYGSIVIEVPDTWECEYAEEGAPRYTGGTYALDYMRGRGESTWAEAKKPYKIKLEDKADLFGMGESKNWALIANFFDPSFVRNRLTYHLGRALGLEYTPRLVPVELVINGDYQGLYYLSETVRVEPSRVAIEDLDDLNPEDGNITGGYLISMCRKWEADGHLFETRRLQDMLIVSPEEIKDKDVPEEKLTEMFDYIIDYYQKTEDAVFSADGRDGNGVHYTEYMDLDSMVKVYLIQESSMNRDAYHTDSTYLYKPRDGKLYWGPLWDFDLCAWGGDTIETYLADDAEAASAAEGFYQSYSWIRALRGDPVFVDAVKRAWGGRDCSDPGTLRYQLCELVKEGGLLDQYEAELSAAASANADIPGYTWREIIDQAGELEQPLLETDLSGEIYRLRRWITARIAWMDANIDSFVDPAAWVQLTFVSDGVTVGTISAMNGEAVFGFPVPEAKKGYFFTGWYADAEIWDEETGQEILVPTRFDDGSCFFEDTLFTAGWAAAEDVVLPEAIFLETDEAWIRTSVYRAFGCTVMPEGACDAVFFRSSDPFRAYIDPYGELAVADLTGDVTITAETVNGLKAECLVHILPTAEQEEALYASGESTEPHSDAIYTFEADQTEFRMKPGEYRKVEIRYDPPDAVKPDLRVLNANESVAYMTQEGVIVAVGEGIAVIFIVQDQKDEALRLTVEVAK